MSVTDPSKPLAGRVALVTGASRGIGRAAALGFAAAGAHVIALARTTGALEELDDGIKQLGSSATLVPVDLKDGEALDRLGAAVINRWGKLDIFLANAGILGPITPLADLDVKSLDDAIAINVTANWRLIRALDKSLRRSDAGRVIMLSSSAATRIRPYWGAYAMTKAAVDVMARTYAEETLPTSPIKVMVFNPGRTDTAMLRLAHPGMDFSLAATPDQLVPDLIRLASPDWMDTGKLYDFPTRTVLTYQQPV